MYCPLDLTVFVDANRLHVIEQVTKIKVMLLPFQCALSLLLLGTLSSAFLFSSNDLAPTRNNLFLRATASLLPPAISIEDLSCTHNGGETYQLRDASYVLARGAKVALIGRNGAGKSTFLKILAESCRDGDVDETNFRYTGKVNRAKDARVAIVEQEPPMPSVSFLLFFTHFRIIQADSNAPFISIHVVMLKGCDSF
jgi:hypothetical protein